ncbi:SAM hydroxide adenosyltransferase [Halorientalis salina]|uniref:SAM hydroxide adenosyltransferase n=1 Tax=Halorientalis salina TaxID=2932266 RepID=UPI0010AD8539|nr:SAM hydroxide adenosyltransferase [Halorientalis salina]
MFIHLIADYGKSDPAFSEVVHRLKHELPDADVQPTAVPPLSTIATGFWIEQLGLHNPPFEDLLLYSNTAPRTAETGPRRNNEGGALCYLELDNGVPVVAVDVGYNLSFVREHIRELREIDVSTGGSQFRSRDYFPTKVAELARGTRDSLGAKRAVEDVPARPQRTVCHVDGYGNIKTSIRASEFDPDGDRVTVELNSRRREVTVKDRVFAVPEGTLTIAPGSTGGDDQYVELFLRGGSAAKEFGQPSPGTELSIQ